MSLTAGATRSLELIVSLTSEMVGVKGGSGACGFLRFSVSCRISSLGMSAGSRAEDSQVLSPADAVVSAVRVCL